jgi:hypothetical protein
MDRVFWHIICGAGFISLLAYTWALAAGAVRVPWYGSIGLIILQLLIALLGMMGLDKKEE